MKNKKGYLQECNDLFIDKWHDTECILPESGEDVWFIFNGTIEVGVYEEEQEMFCMADELGVPLSKVRQWKSVGSDKNMVAYPYEREVVAIEIPELDCLALGHFTNHYEDLETGDEVKAVLLDGIYEFEGTEDMAIAWEDVFGYYSLPQPPLKVIDVCDEQNTVIEEVPFLPQDTVECCNEEVTVNCPICGGNPCECSSEIKVEEETPKKEEEPKSAIVKSAIVESKHKK